ncbi:MAG: serine/threonine protein kinase, partial [Candidatus Riflebacteria bacterium]|nr:serine/threonine protein kinase [Candidatus Riflebacteria bacterium]
MQTPFPAECARRFDARRLLATGGHGAVFLARQKGLDRDVVVKLLHRIDDPVRRARFEAEARVTASLAHPNVVVVIDFGVADDVPWIAYE